MPTRLTIDEMKQIAANRKGRCLSEVYQSSSKKLLWECEQKHQWNAVPNAVKRGSWCPICANENHGSIERYTIEAIKNIITKKGGRCLSDELSNSKSRIAIECDQGHRWETTAKNIKRGTWCPECANHHRYSIQEIKEIAKQRDGICISDEYVNNRTALLWECKFGHRWEAVPYSVISQKTWCPVCAGTIPYTIHEIQKIAEERGGKCISEEYRGVDEKLLWECKFGHRWEAVPYSVISQKTWCPVCADVVCTTIGEMKALAVSKGGECLSNEIINAKVKLEWRCAKKHTWKSTINQIKRGYWCPTCAREELSKKLTFDIDFVKETIQLKGGKWLSGAFINSNSLLQLQCDKGHIWSTSFKYIMRGRWCPKCAGNKRLDIEEMRKVAKERGGKCLSHEYINTNSKLLWECKFEHRWEAAPKDLRRGRWCPVCAKLKHTSTKKLTIIDMQEIAAKKGGKCISQVYVNSKEKLTWECSEGHQWDASPHCVKSTTWCPVCGKSQKLTLEKMQDLAQQRKGKCLSLEYENSKSELLWECEKGHQWKAKPNVIQQGHWCPTCANNQVGTIEEMQELAAQRKGRCLSTVYINSSEKLTWECEKKHKFKMPARDAKDGHWCPRCAYINNGMNARLTVTDLQNMADKYNGKCLSSEYIGYKRNHLWECEKGHQWEGAVWKIKKGFWCPECEKLVL